MFSENTDILKNIEEERLTKVFDACVNVIKSLPKNGDYKPSNEVLLTYYANFKQATVGKCNISKPWAVDVVNRAKWDAWNSIAHMSKQEAMTCYASDVIKVFDKLPSTKEKDDLKSLLDPLHKSQNQSHGDHSVEQVTNVKVDNEPNVNVVETENKPAVLEATSEIPNCQSESDDEFLEPSQFLPGEDGQLQGEELSEDISNKSNKNSPPKIPETEESVKNEVQYISESKFLQLQNDVLSKLDSLKSTNENISSELSDLKLQFNELKNLIESRRQTKENRLNKRKFNSLGKFMFPKFNWTNFFFYVLWPLVVSYSINRITKKF